MFIYSALFCFFFFRKVFIPITMMVTLFLFFIFTKIFISVLGHLSQFFFFFFRKTLVPFLHSFSKFFLVFLIILIKIIFNKNDNHFYMCIQKNVIFFKIVINHFLYRHKNFSIGSKKGFKM